MAKKKVLSVCKDSEYYGQTCQCATCCSEHCSDGVGCSMCDGPVLGCDTGSEDDIDSE